MKRMKSFFLVGFFGLSVQGFGFTLIELGNVVSGSPPDHPCLPATHPLQRFAPIGPAVVNLASTFEGTRDTGFALLNDTFSGTDHESCQRIRISRSAIGFGIVDYLPRPSYTQFLIAGEVAGNATRVELISYSMESIASRPCSTVGPQGGICTVTAPIGRESEVRAIAVDFRDPQTGSESRKVHIIYQDFGSY